MKRKLAKKVISFLTTLAIISTFNNVFALDAPVLTTSTAGLDVVLTWTTIADATGYTLHYAPYPYLGAHTIAQANMGTESHFEATLWNGASYYVAVTSKDGSTESGYSNINLFTINATSQEFCDINELEYCATISDCTGALGYWHDNSCNEEPELLMAPTGLASQGMFLDIIRIRWTTVSGADAYNVYYSRSISGRYLLLGTALKTGVNHLSVPSNTYFYYKVTAIVGSEESATSSIFSGYTAAQPPTTLSCYDSSIISPTPFMGNDGEIFKLADGSFWEIMYEYEYMYEYYPSVTICPEKQTIDIDGNTLKIKKLTNVTESKISGTSKGFDGDTIFTLTNGQIWQQTEYYYHYHYSYRPDVLIYQSGSGYKIKIDDIDRSVGVTRIN